MNLSWADPEGGGRGSGPLPEKKKKKTKKKNNNNIGILSSTDPLSSTGPDPLKNHKATTSAFNAGPFKWRFACGPMIAR